MGRCQYNKDQIRYLFIVSAFVMTLQYYAHREKMRLIGREADLEKINRTALRLARKVADDTGTLMAGNICNLNIYDRADPSWEGRAHAMFKVR